MLGVVVENEIREKESEEKRVREREREGLA